MHLSRLTCLLLLGLLFGIMGTTALAQPTVGDLTAPKYSNEFLSIGVGARSLGMGKTQAALARGVDAGYWNPAGLAGLPHRYQLALMHSPYFSGIANYDYVGFASAIDTLTSFGITAVRFAVDDIPDTRFLYNANGVIDYSQISFFSAADYGFFFHYARESPVVPGLKVGGSAKVVYRQAGPFAQAWGFGIDLGAQYQTQGWHFGLVLRDVTGTFNAWSHNTELLADVFAQTGNDIPDNSIEVTLPRAILGAAKTLTVASHWQLTTAVDVDFTFDGARNTLLSSSLASIDPHAGLEVGYKQMLFVRGGIGQAQRIEDFTGEAASWSVQPDFGVGIQRQRFVVDYALSNIGGTADGLLSHVFSLTFNW